ncbi:DNA primase [Rhodococcus hoagii]|nr:DNA primase [Prescottella equi]
MEPTSPNRRFTNEFLTELRTRVRLEALATDYVDLKPAGAGRLKGLCPMHSERTPSFNINIDWGRFHCFGCGADGDIIDFLMQADGVSFVDAVTDLAGRAGMALPQGSNPDSDADLRARAQLRAVLESAQKILHQWLFDHPDARRARDFLRSRRFTSAHAADWGIGYNPTGGDTLTAALTSAGHTLDAQTAAGLTKQSDRGPYDAFRGRIVWPLYDPQGRIVGFTGRDLTGRPRAPRYLNTDATELFRKGEVLFGYDKARQQMLRQRQVFVVEGQTDVMAMTAAGIANTVGASGTAFTPTQTDLLASRIGDGGEIVIAFDNDDAGRKAAWSLFQACQRFTTNITALDLTNYATKADPCEVRLLGGDDALTAAIAARRPALQMLLDADITRSDLTTPEGKVNATEQVRRRLSAVSSAVLRREYQRWAADRIGVHTNDIPTSAIVHTREPAAQSATNRPARLTDAETALAAFCITHPHDAAPFLERASTDLYSLFSPAVAELVDMSTSMFPDGPPADSSEAGLWATVMTDVIDADHQPLLWQIAFTEAPEPDTIDDTIARVQRMRLLHQQTVLQRRLAESDCDQIGLLRHLADINRKLRGSP